MMQGEALGLSLASCMGCSLHGPRSLLLPPSVLAMRFPTGQATALVEQVALAAAVDADVDLDPASPRPVCTPRVPPEGA